MRPRAIALRLAAVLLPAVVLGSGCGLVGGGGDDRYPVVVYFDRAVALYEGSQVRVLGLPSGTVRNIEIEGTRVRVDVDMDRSIDLPVDVRAILIPQSLIGERYIQLTPVWTPSIGGQTLADRPEPERIIQDDGNDENGREVTIPVEPDEALAALNEFLQSLEPEGLGRLVGNLSTALDGNGEQLGVALSGIADLVDTFARRDTELASIVDNFDEFTQTLATRESQLGEILDSFARTTRILADERLDLEALLDGLARVSVDGFDLVAEHATALRTDLETLALLGQSIVVNLDAVTQLLDAGPLLIDGLENAYNPAARAMNLRTQLGPVAQQALNPVLRFLLGDPSFSLPCIPIDTACAPLGSLSQAGPAVVTEVAPAHTPVDDILA
ncbi:MAG: MCE family protein, partial [Actinomycetota bacterium]|nr:MCE family protein [Actinomycetota bacterium]